MYSYNSNQMAVKQSVLAEHLDALNVFTDYSSESDSSESENYDARKQSRNKHLTRMIP